MQIHRFKSYPSRKEIFKIWNAAKALGEIPSSWSFRQHGSIEKTYLFYVLVAK